MLYGIIADIHGNLEAFRTVLAELRGVDRMICAGDIVGYGPEPNECLDLILSGGVSTVAGNHDKAAVGEMDISGFNPAARLAIEWTAEQLTESHKDHLRQLPLTLEFPDFQLVHGSLVDPLEEYLMDDRGALPTFQLMKKPLLFVGHTHQPLRLSSGDKEIINPGSVGQPRDGDPRASYGIYDDEKKEFILHRTEYNIAQVQEKMRLADLPQLLIDRLSYGF